MPVRPEMQMAMDAANNAESGLDAVYDFAKVINDSPDTVGFIIDQMGEQAPVILSQIIGTKGAGALITGSGKMALATRMAAGGGFASFTNTVGSNTGEYMEGDVANFDEAVKKGATRSAAQAGVDALTSALIPVKFGPSQFINVPTQLGIQGAGGAAGEYAGAKAVGEEVSRGELVAEGMLELLGAPGDVISATMSPSSKTPNDAGSTSGETLEDVYSDMARREVDKSEAAAATQKPEPAIPDTGEWGVFPNVGGSYSVLNPATGENAGTFDSEQEAESAYQSKIVEAATQKPEPAIPDAPTSEAPDIANVEVDINAQRAELDNDLAEVDQGLAAARAALREEPRTSIPPTSDLQTDTEVAVAPDLEADPFADIPDGLPQLEADALTITADDMAQMDLDDSENQVQIDQEIAAFNASTAATNTELAPELPVAPVKKKLVPLSQIPENAAQTKKVDPKLVDPTKDDLLTAIAKIGGITRTEAASEGFDPADFQMRRGGLKPVFRAKEADAVSIDAARETLAQSGYIDADSTVNDFVDLLQKAVRGETVVSTANEAYLEVNDAARTEDYIAQGGETQEALTSLKVVKH